MKKFNLINTSYLLKDVKNGERGFVLLSNEDSSLSFFINNSLLLYKYGVFYDSITRIKEFLSVTEEDVNNYQVIELFKENDKFYLDNIKNNESFTYYNKEVDINDYKETGDWICIDVEVRITNKSLVDYLDEIKEKKERYIQEEKKEIKREIELAQTLEKENDQSELLDVEKIQEGNNLLISFDDPEFDIKIKRKNINELNFLLEKANKEEKYENAALIRDELEKRK